MSRGRTDRHLRRAGGKVSAEEGEAAVGVTGFGVAAAEAEAEDTGSMEAMHIVVAPVAEGATVVGRVGTWRGIVPARGVPVAEEAVGLATIAVVMGIWRETAVEAVAVAPAAAAVAGRATAAEGKGTWRGTAQAAAAAAVLVGSGAEVEAVVEAIATTAVSKGTSLGNALATTQRLDNSW